MSGMRRVLSLLLAFAMVISLGSQLSFQASAEGSLAEQSSSEASSASSGETSKESTGDTSKDQSSDSSAKKSSDKSEDKSADQSSGKDADKSAEKSAGKEADKSADKSTGKEADKGADQSAGKEKEADKSSQKKEEKSEESSKQDKSKKSDGKRASSSDSGLKTQSPEDHHAEYTPWNSENSLPDAQGKYVLQKDVTLSDTWRVPSGDQGVTLCLNGKTISVADSKDCTVIYVGKDSEGKKATLTLEDCTNNGAVKKGNASMWTISDNSQMRAGGGVFVDNGGTFRMSGGSITGNKSAVAGGGIYVNKGGSCVLSGTAKVENNTAHEPEVPANGSDLYVSESTLTLSSTVALKAVSLNKGKIKYSDSEPFEPGTKLKVYPNVDVPFTEDFAKVMKEGKKPGDYFESNTNGYALHLTRAGEAVLHKDELTYTLGTGENNNTLTVSCSGADCSTIASATLTLKAESKDYTGEPVTATLSGTEAFNKTSNLAVSSDAIEYYCGEEKLAGAPADAGDYIAKLTVAENTLQASFTINKAAPKVTRDVAGAQLTYTGQAQQLFATGTVEGGEMLYCRTKDGDYSTKTLKGRGAGKYTMWCKVVGDKNHLDVEPYSFVTTIAKAELTVTAKSQKVTIGGLNFDKSLDAVTATGLVEGQTLKSVSLTHTSFTKETKKGRIVPTAAKIYNGETDVTKYYKITYKSGTLTVVPRLVTKVVSVGGGLKGTTFSITLASAEKLMKAVGQSAAYKCGDQMVFSLKVSKKKASSVSSKESSAAKKLIGTNGTVAQYLDLQLWLKVGKKSWQITNVGESSVILTAPVPKSAQGTGRTYYLISIHKGKASALASSTTATLKAKANGFSTYAIAYRNKAAASSSSSTAKKLSSAKSTGSRVSTGTGTRASGTSSRRSTNPRTGDMTRLAPWVVLCVGSAVGMAALVLKGRRRRGGKHESHE